MLRGVRRHRSLHRILFIAEKERSTPAVPIGKSSSRLATIAKLGNNANLSLAVQRCIKLSFKLQGATMSAQADPRFLTTIDFFQQHNTPLTPPLGPPLSCSKLGGVIRSLGGLNPPQGGLYNSLHNAFSMQQQVKILKGS